MFYLPFPFQILDHARESGYSSSVLTCGFSRVWENLTKASIEELMLSEAPALLERAPVEVWANGCLPFEERQKLAYDCPVKKLFLVTASTVPSAAFQDLLVSLLLPIRVTIRPARNLVPMMRELVNHLRAYAKEWGNRVEICDVGHDDEALRKVIAEHDVLNVSGSDETIAHYRSLLPKERTIRVIEHGHRISAAAVLSSDVHGIMPKEYDDLATDISLWDGNGCLTPKVIFFEGEYREAEKFSQILSGALNDVAEKFPEVEPDVLSLVSINSAIQMAKLKGVKIFKCAKNHDVIALFPPQLPFEPLLYTRVTSIFCVSSAVEAAQQLAPRGQAFAMRETPPNAVIQQLLPAGFNYFCSFGQMQNPPLSWKHDGIGTLKPLLDKE